MPFPFAFAWLNAFQAVRYSHLTSTSPVQLVHSQYCVVFLFVTTDDTAANTGQLTDAPVSEMAAYIKLT